MPDVEGDKPVRRKFKAYAIGYFHIDIAEVQTAEGRLYLYVAIDRTSKFAFVQVVRKTGRTSASAFLMALIEAVPYRIHTVLTDNVLCPEGTADLGIGSLSRRVIPARFSLARVQRVVNERSLP